MPPGQCSKVSSSTKSMSHSALVTPILLHFRALGASGTNTKTNTKAIPPDT